MEGFLEANRVVEVSFNKLASIHKRGDLPLRKTLLISKALNRAQEAATSAHFTIMSSPTTTTPRGSSKLLASISKKVVEDASLYESDCIPAGPVSRPTKPQQREQSPIASSVVARQEDDDVPMDFDSVTSVLSNILDNDGAPAGISTKTAEGARSPKMASSPLQTTSNRNEQDVGSPTTKRSRLFEDISNSAKAWSSLDHRTDAVNALAAYQWPSAHDTTNTWSPPSPVKRPHSEAFPFEKENCTLFETSFEDPKRFKPSPPEGCPLESLPGFCGYITPKAFQSAPHTTYVFGNAFSHPSDGPSSSWPSSHLEHELPMKDDQSFADYHFPTPIPTQYSAILAF